MIDKKIKYVHLIGIKGVAMTALAVLFKEAGIKVTGSDTKEVFITDTILKQKKIKWKIGFKQRHIIGRPDLVIVTGAHQGLSNPEAQAAKKRNLKVVTQAQALGIITRGYQTIAVCGVGGKTTTSSMIAALLSQAGLDPCYIVGTSAVNPLGAGGHFGRGKYFVCEADEYATDPVNDLTPKFMWLNPKVIVITNIEYDHPDVYQDLLQTRQTFIDFTDRISSDGVIIVCGDNENIRTILKEIKGRVFTYGYNKVNNYHIKTLSKENGEQWQVFNKEKLIGEFNFQLWGKHNILNATGAIATVLNLGVPLNQIQAGIRNFRGVKRRLELVKEVNGIFLYDDYAHHPTEIRITLETLKTRFSDKRLICIFQPHTYSRTKALFNDFAKSFSSADMVIIADIYASAREKKDESACSEKLAREINKHQSKAKYLGDLNSVVDFLGKTAKKGDVIITMGAGDIFNYHQKIINNLKNQKSDPKIAVVNSGSMI